ncbi:hypothetical protein BHM03_00053031 [Ensete ventricosum]|nr:hypothetical protein BHM03_00053031 [Ensete ventricosum]
MPPYWWGSVRLQVGVVDLTCASSAVRHLVPFVHRVDRLRRFGHVCGLAVRSTAATHLINNPLQPPQNRRLGRVPASRPVQLFRAPLRTAARRLVLPAAPDSIDGGLLSSCYSSPIPSSNRFVRAVGDPLVEYKEPVFEWERANDAWKLWDFVPLGSSVLLLMLNSKHQPKGNAACSPVHKASSPALPTDKDPTATFEADKRRAEETLDRLQRQVELECEIHKAYPFLSEKALLPLWQLLPTSSPNSEEEGWQESAPVPAAAGWQQLDEQQHSSHSTLAPIFRSEPEEEEEQHHQSEISSPKLGAWLVELHQNSRFRSMPIVGSRSNSVAYISEPRPEPYLDSQSSFQHCMLWKYEPSDGQYLESSSELPELQHNMPVMQHGDRQQPLYSPSHSATSRGKQRGTEDLMPTPGAEKVEQYNLRHWKQRFGSKRQQPIRKKTTGGGGRGTAGAMEIQEASEDEEISPIEQVRLTVRNTDDPTLPVWTFRMWFLGLASVCLMSFLNQFFSYRSEPLVITQITVQVASLPLGHFLARVLPTRRFRLPGLGQREFSLNPGPFNMKEHVLISIFANAGCAFGNGSAYAVGIVNIIRAFYRRSISFIAGWLLIITTQVQRRCHDVLLFIFD